MIVEIKIAGTEGVNTFEMAVTPLEHDFLKRLALVSQKNQDQSGYDPIIEIE